MFLRIEAPHFVAGIDDEAAAPIIRYMLGWSEQRIFDYCRRKGWSVYKLDHPTKVAINYVTIQRGIALMSMLPVWKVTDLGPGKLGIQCPQEDCKGKAVVGKKWAKPRLAKHHSTEQDIMIVGRPCTYCFKTAQVPENFKGGKPRG